MQGQRRIHYSGVLLGVLALLFLQTIAFASDQGYYVYVCAESEDEVAIIHFDGQKAETIKRIKVGAWPLEIEGPHGITVSPDGKYWFLTMAHGIPFGKLYKYSTADNTLLGQVELGLFPATMQMSAATGLLYVVNFNLHGEHEPSTVSVVEPESMEEIERIETGIMPHGSRISPDGLRHYSVAMMSDELYEIDTATLEITRRLHVGKNGMMKKMGSDHKKMKGMDHEKMKGMDHGKMKKGGMDHKPSKHASGDHTSMKKVKVQKKKKMKMGGMDHGKMKMAMPTWAFPHPSKPFVYVANNGVAEVVEVDTKKWEISRRFTTAKGPYNIEVSPDGKIMVVTYKSAASTGIWDLEKGVELAKIDNSRKVSHGVVISPDNRYAFVSVEGIGAQPGAVDVIDLKTKKIVAIAEVGKQAGGIAFWKMAKK